jgi:hypothetical protein
MGRLVKMIIISKSTLINNIGLIQLKLFDFSDEKIDFEEKLKKDYLKH